MTDYLSIFVKGKESRSSNRQKGRILSRIADAYQNMQAVLGKKVPKRVPVVLWYSRGALGYSGGAENIRQYYMNPIAKLSTQILPLEKFPGLLILPGVHHDFGFATEPSAFGCKIRWDENNPPQAESFLDDLSSIACLLSPNPNRDGLFPLALDHYRRMLELIDPGLLEAYPMLRASTCILGPLEIAGYMYGQTKFYLGLATEGDGIHELLDYITKGVIDWLSALAEINGGHQIISIIEHTPSLISPAYSEAFVVPYLTKIRQAFPEAVFLYHNEGPSNHYLPLIPDFGTDIFHCGDVDLGKAKRDIGGRVILMGNLHPLAILRDSPREEVIRESEKCIALASNSGGFFLSSGGGLAMPAGATPEDNIFAMLEATGK